MPALWDRVIAGVEWQPQTAYAGGAVVTHQAR
jgi:chitodextrinase